MQSEERSIWDCASLHHHKVDVQNGVCNRANGGNDFLVMRRRGIYDVRPHYIRVRGIGALRCHPINQYAGRRIQPKPVQRNAIICCDIRCPFPVVEVQKSGINHHGMADFRNVSCTLNDPVIYM